MAVARTLLVLLVIALGTLAGGALLAAVVFVVWVAAGSVVAVGAGVVLLLVSLAAWPHLAAGAVELLGPRG